MVRLTWGFCTDEINSNNTKLSIRYNVTVEFISPLYDTNTGELLFFFNNFLRIEHIYVEL